MNKVFAHFMEIMWKTGLNQAEIRKIKSSYPHIGVGL